MASSSTPSYTALERTLFTPVDQLEVLCEIRVDFKSLAENGYDFFDVIKFQGWENYFGRLVGPVYPSLVKEFWIHATACPKFIISSVMGIKMMITEESIKRIIGYEHENVPYVPAARRDMNTICSEIFIHGLPSNKIKDLKPGYRIWAKIFLGSIFHRKSTNSPDYLNSEQMYLLYCLGKGILVDLPHFLFEHLHAHVKETRDSAKNQSRNWIAMGRLLSDFMTETGLVDSLKEAE